MKTYKDLCKEIKRQQKEIREGQQIDYAFGDWCADANELDNEILKYFLVSGGYNFETGNNKLKALCEIIQ